jgi:DNA polymerase III delta subunit|tara:strand:+ start:242 stop:1168 length:927 start_codon:yes stop_codon:yes gene_type:complete
VIKQDIADQILQSLKLAGFNDKVSLHQDELDKAEEIISRNVGGSLFQEKLILHLKHTSGKFPEKIKMILENQHLYNSDNLALIVESSIEKTPASGAWIKYIDEQGLIVNCSKLKTNEEKIWLKRQLEFLPKSLLPMFGGSIFQNNEGNLLGQMNEVRLLKLLFNSKQEIDETETTNIVFHSGLSAFELEDVIIDRKFEKVLQTINFLKEHDSQNSAPLIWMIAKIINSCLEATLATNKKSALIKSGVWSSKIGQYLSLTKNSKASEFMRLSDQMLRLDLINKGIIKSNVWEQIEKIILQLRGATEPQH